MPRFHSGTAFDSMETTKTKFPPTPNVLWQQPPEISIDHQTLDIVHFYSSAFKTNETIQELENKQLTEVASQTEPPDGMQRQRSVTATDQFQKN